MNVSKTDLEKRLNEIPDILRDAVFADENDEVIYSIIEKFHLSNVQERRLARTCLLVFLGFLRIKDLFEELVQDVKLDSKTALAVFQELDQKVFANHRAEIENNYRNFQTGSRITPEEVEPIKTQEQVLLRKENSPETVDLSLKDIPVENNANVANTYTNNAKGGQPIIQSSGPAPIPVGTGTVIINKIPEQPKNTGIPPLSTNHSPLTTPQSGPVIIHKVEEAQSVGQINAVKGYKQMSFGSFMGSFGTPQSKASNVSRAEVEIPSFQQSNSSITNNTPPAPHTNQQQSSTQPTQVPFLVKKYDSVPPSPQPNEQAKVVHYTFDENQK
ncbi:MAG: hypothetical protein M1320_00420 [Patescibacteria group bacterium]|nr:hypothetical protein [Patescibacteria group bacterium]